MTCPRQIFRKYRGEWCAPHWWHCLLWDCCCCNCCCCCCCGCQGCHCFSAVGPHPGRVSRPRRAAWCCWVQTAVCWATGRSLWRARPRCQAGRLARIPDRYKATDAEHRGYDLFLLRYLTDQTKDTEYIGYGEIRRQKQNTENTICSCSDTWQIRGDRYRTLRIR